MLLLTCLLKPYIYPMNHGHTTFTVAEARAKLERYCAYQDRSHRQVVEKLKAMRMIPEAQEQIITHLIAHNFLNESRFAQSFARGKFRIKKWGKSRITLELKRHDIGRYNIALALKEISDADYRATFEELVSKRTQQLSHETNSYKKKRKLVDYLLYRGWESHWVYEAAADLD